MDKITKLLRTLTSKERGALAVALSSLMAGDTHVLDIKKLRGYTDIFRLRIKHIRVIFRRTGSDIRLLEISRRNEKTYRDF